VKNQVSVITEWHDDWKDEASDEDLDIDPLFQLAISHNLKQILLNSTPGEKWTEDWEWVRKYV